MGAKLGTLVILGALATASAMPPAPAAAADTRGLLIVVNTTSDALFPDGRTCSLRAAIEASNAGGAAGHCLGSSGRDAIRFDLGSGVPVIKVNSPLPVITQPVSIRGNTGGARRVKVDGAGFLVRSPADGTSISGMDLPSIRVEWADDVTIVGNVLGGTQGNVLGGIEGTSAGNLRIGGSNPGTPDPCSGDCNLIIGARSGIYLTGANGLIAGNFIGVDATGNAAAPNQVGISISSGGGLTIGGTTPDARNVIGGNRDAGILVNGCGSCIIQGNHIGTNAAGNAAIPNGGPGIRVQSSRVTIGGSAPGAGNLISGNAGHGIFSNAANGRRGAPIVIHGNRIGIKAGGGRLGNGGDGIHLERGSSLGASVEGAVIGSADARSAANIIAYNGGAGVGMHDGSTESNEVRGNSIHHNAGPGIELIGGANHGIAAPTITGLPLAGTACAGCVVDIYSDAENEGRVHEGAVTADGTGAWTYPGRARGPRVTATSTNAQHSTSMFSGPYLLPRPDGRIRVGTSRFVGDDVYNKTADGQTRTGAAAPGRAIVFGISVQSDGRSDRFKVVAAGASSTHYLVRYTQGTTDITAAVAAGTYTTPMLDTGGTVLITATVRVRSTAPLGSRVVRLVTITSVGDPTKQDAVKLVARRD